MPILRVDVKKLKTRTWKTNVIALTVILLVGVAAQSSLVSVQAQRYTRYILTASVNDPGAGSVSPSFGTFSYGDVVRLIEQPNDGYVFDGWYQNGEFMGKMSTLTLTMYRSYDIMAVFSKRMVTLTITANPQGAGTTAPSPNSWTYAFGTSIKVKQYPSEGKVFDGWYLDGIYQGTSEDYTVFMDGDHQLDAYFATQQTVRPEPSEDKVQSLIEFSCKSSASYSSFSATIRGAITSNGVSLAHVPVIVSYSVTGGDSWTDLTMINTDNNGAFTAVWMPQVTGDYLLKAVWNGNATFAQTTSTIDFGMMPFQQESVFSFTTNSTLTEMAYNSNNSQLSFTVSGETGTTGYVYVYIPKSLMSDASNLKVWMDQHQLAATTLSDDDSWLVYLTYTHSSHVVTLDLTGATSVIATSDNNLLLYGVVVAVVAAILVVSAVALRKRRKS